jgi:hypothetical protein
MSVSGGPSIVTSNLLLNLEVVNPKSYSYSENLLTYSQQFNVSPWSLGGTGSPLITANTVTAPDGTLTASTLYGNGGTNSNRVQQTITVTANTNYNFSFYIKNKDNANASYFHVSFPSSGKNNSEAYVIWTGNTISGFSNTGTTQPKANYITDGWYRVSMLASSNYLDSGSAVIRIYPSGNDGTIQNNVYIWGAQVEKNTSIQNYVPTTASAVNQSLIVRDTISTYSPTLSNTAFYNYNSNGTFTFTRSTTAIKDGGGLIGSYPTGPLSVGNFIYNDHTWEIWFKIDDVNPGNYDGTEAFSALAVYQGFHQGFQYGSNVMYYYIWDYDGVTATSIEAARWTLGTSGTQLIQGNWHQLVVTNNNKTFIPYVNGVQLGTGSTPANLRFNNLFNGGVISIGKAAAVAANVGSYLYYSKSTFGGMKMYNRALSADEVQQNFNAQRGRYGL